MPHRPPRGPDVVAPHQSSAALKARVLAAASQFRWANLLTYLAISASLVAIVFTTGPDSRSWAGAGIAAAFAFDLFDGRFARLFPRTREDEQVGIELDSLADVLAFGLTPAVCVLRVVDAPGLAAQAALLFAAICYVLCIVTRLAHFNVFQAGTGGFIGLPSTIAGLLFAVLFLWVPRPWVAVAVLTGIGAAAVSGVRIGRPGRPVVYILLAIGVLVGGMHVFRLRA
jgi:CDP-diacylglycerol--serine O-phosphatidyltransferase